jgi:hypothetical protein
MNLGRNLGLGDGLILVPAVEEMSKDDEIDFPSFPRDVPTFESIFDGNPNVTVYAARNEDDIRALGTGIMTGFMGGNPNGHESLDEWFYRQLNMPLEIRLESTLIRDKSEDYPQEGIPGEPYIFVHDDDNRRITKRLDHGTLIVRPRLRWDSILECREQIESAQEVHVIPSALKEFVSALQPEGVLFLHQYARQPFNEVLDSTKSPHTWTILK